MPNIHPAFVHFPIALLIVYAFLELISATRAKHWPHVESAKNVCLFFGTLGAFASLATGDVAEEAMRGSSATVRRLIETHSLWANIMTFVFVAILLARLIVWFSKHEKLQDPRLAWLKKVMPMLAKVSGFIEQPPVVYFLAVLGAIGITITGALGASIVYGPSVDPVVSFIYSLLMR